MPKDYEHFPKIHLLFFSLSSEIFSRLKLRNRYIFLIIILFYKKVAFILLGFYLGSYNSLKNILIVSLVFLVQYLCTWVIYELNNCVNN